MMKKLNLIYWNSENFGDYLNKFLIEKLSGTKTQHKEWDTYYKNSFRLLISALYRSKYSFIRKIIFKWQTTYICIGSIISWSNKKSKIWGAGFMNYDETFNGGHIFAVRGQFTAQKLRDIGVNVPNVFGDPALILPLIIEKKYVTKYKLAIIPHWKETDFFIEKYSENYKIIDLRTKDIESVVNEIQCCEYVLSTSLHGLIVAHSYNIPALWIKKGYIDTDGFKFSDYFSSVDIPLYDGFENFDVILQSEDNWRKLFSENQDKILINNLLSTLQLELLNNCPFSIKKDIYMKLNGHIL